MTSKSSPVPVVVFHKGNSPYLEICLRQISKTNPRSRIILIGDAANDRFDFVEHENAADFPSFKEFRPHYKHRSFLKEEFELVCIERWFAIQDWLRREKVERFLHLDSDVLLYSDVTEEAKRFDGFDWTFARWDESRLLPHYLFINRPSLIEDFCRYISAIYQNDGDFQRLIETNTYFHRGKSKTWISDMSLFNDFVARFQPETFYLEDAIGEKVGYDSRITEGGAFKMFRGVCRKHHVKRIVFENGVPYARLKSTGEKIPMKAIHYHSHAKYFMPFHSQGKSAIWAFFWHTLIFEHKRVKKWFGKNARNRRVVP